MKTFFSLSTFDPRLKIIVAAAIGVLTWHVPVYALAAYAIFILFLGFTNSVHLTLGIRTVAAYAYFILGWTVIKFAMDCTPLLSGTTPDYATALTASAILGLRLTILISIGLLLATSSSARQLGLALSWFLRPFMGKRSWEPALSLALMIHFIPLVQRTFSQVIRAMELRNPPRSKWHRFTLIPQAVLRICAQKTWTQTVAVAARKLDSPDAWVPNFPPCYGQLTISFLLILTAYSPILLTKV